MFDSKLFHPQTPVKDVDKQKYMDGLIKFIGNRQICVEVCLSSNFQTEPELRQNLLSHPFKKFLEEHISVCLNTDNR